MSASLARLVCWGAAFCFASSAQAATGYVRVAQIGYEAGLPIRAYWMSASPLSGEQFTVENAAGRVAAAGTSRAEAMIMLFSRSG